MKRHQYPEIYMKRKYNKTYFEGWYYKQVDSTRSHTISFIPSVSFTKERSLAYLQVIYQHNEDLITDIVEYDISDFFASDESLFVTVSNNFFSDKKINIDFKGEMLSINGKISFSNLTRLDYSPFTPNIMGIFSYIPFLQCNHGVISMKHSLRGRLKINQETVCFDNGVGYIEKDWGSSFPKEYIWIQCAHFNDSDISMFFSVATVPFLFHNFKGFICNLLFNNKQYRFATYTFSKLFLKTLDGKIEITIKDRNYIFHIRGIQKDSKELLAPKNGGMNSRIKESLTSDLEIKLVDRRTNKTIYKDFSSNASIEIV